MVGRGAGRAHQTSEGDEKFTIRTEALLLHLAELVLKEGPDAARLTAAWES